MIITLIALICLIVGIILFVIDDKFAITYDLPSMFGLYLSEFSIVILLFCGAMILGMNACKDIDYQNMLDERELIEYRIEDKDRDFIGDGKLYNDIVDFNNSLRKVKEGVNNPWTNWFYNDKIATIDYIEMER